MEKPILPTKEEIAKITFEHISSGGINDFMHGMYKMKKIFEERMLLAVTPNNTKPNSH